ncbi:MAG TPA: L,D-transpeptidase family protein [Sphingomicrobium sp.]
MAGLSALGACSVPTRTEPAAANQEAVAVAAPNGCGDVASFYAQFPNASIWVNRGQLSPKGRALAAALARQRVAPPPEVSEQAMATAFVRHASHLSAAPAGRPIVYVDRAVEPRAPCASRLLALASGTPRLELLLERMEAPNKFAQALARASVQASDQSDRQALGADLAVARSLGELRRAILVDTNSARLWAVDGNRLADSMKVIVGKAGSETPDMAALMRYAKLNPYWDIPPDLVQSRIAAQIVARGPAVLKERRLIAVDRYGEAPNVLNAAAVDWKAVHKGALKVGVRQLPGRDNMLGRVLFMFPNRLGIYLHDTPNPATFDLADRHTSNGCVRLERAADLYRWSFGRELPPAQSAAPDQRVDLPEPIPVFLLKFSPAGSRALMALSAEGGA